MADFLPILASVPELSAVPQEQLQWLLDQSEILALAKGDYLFRAGEPAHHLMIVLEGKLRVYFPRDRRELFMLEALEISGTLPYSRMQEGRANGEALVPCTVLRCHRDRFPAMIQTQHELTTAFVHSMTNRVRSFTALQQQNEKLMALGKLSAGLAHELNNPAAAVVRSAQELKSHLAYQPERFKDIMRLRIDPALVDEVNAILYQRISGGLRTDLSLMKKTELEEELMDWMDDRAVENGDMIAENMVEFGFTVEELDQVEAAIRTEQLSTVLNWMDGVITTEKLVDEIRDASQRISELVKSVKSYTHMDQDSGKQMVDIHEGIRITVNILKHKFKANGVRFEESFGEDLPPLPGYPGELNQVWTNLLDNALDALAGQPDGVVEVKTVQLGPTIIVKVIDNGPGIPEDVQSRIFEPFFTTKALGQGTGMGLDTVHKILGHHHARIELESRPGRTEFSLVFPLD